MFRTWFLSLSSSFSCSYTHTEGGRFCRPVTVGGESSGKFEMRVLNEPSQPTRASDFGLGLLFDRLCYDTRTGVEVSVATEASLLFETDGNSGFYLPTSVFECK